MNKLGQGIALAGVALAAALLEIHDKPAAGLWVLVVIWAILL